MPTWQIPPVSDKTGLRMKRDSFLLIAFLLLFPLQSVQAGAEHDHDEHHETAATLGSHVHGEVLLNLVIEGNDVAVEMISPAMNLVGFEHTPSTQAQRESVNRVLTRLADPDTLFSLPSEAGCELISSEIETALAGDAPQTDAATGHDAQDHGGQTAEHSDFHAFYQMRCANAGAIDTLNLALFGIFPGVENVRLQWIDNLKQGAVQRDASNPVVDLH